MKTCEWHLEDYLDTPEMVVEYLNQVIEDGDQDELVRAIGYLSRAKGMTTIARNAGVSRETLYASFNTGGNLERYTDRAKNEASDAAGA